MMGMVVVVVRGRNENVLELDLYLSLLSFGRLVGERGGGRGLC